MTSPPVARRRPPGRYDEPSLTGQRVLAVILGVLFVGLLVAIAAALYGRIAGEQVRGRVISFDIVDSRTVRLDIEVSKSAGGQAFCVMRARGRDGLEVGRDIAALDPVGTDERVSRGTFTLTTSAPAVTGELAGCTEQRLTQDDITP